MKGVIRFALGILNVPDKTVEDIDKSLPGFARLVDVIRDAEPMIKRCAPHIDAIKPDIMHLIELAEKAWPDVEAVLPTVDELLDYVEGKQK